LFCLIRHPLIIAPIGAQRQALLTERLRSAAIVRICSLMLFCRNPLGERRKLALDIDRLLGFQLRAELVVARTVTGGARRDPACGVFGKSQANGGVVFAKRTPGLPPKGGRPLVRLANKPRPCAGQPLLGDRSHGGARFGSDASCGFAASHGKAGSLRGDLVSSPICSPVDRLLACFDKGEAAEHEQPPRGAH
jgi:hypothetical protein